MGKINRPKIIVISGPTASGKSDLAIQLARKFNGELISADSRQVYRGMDIGTGKVTKKEQRLARHWLLDIASPTRQYSVAQWKKAAQKAIIDITGRGKTPIICGGTAFWIDALVYDLALPDVKPDAKLRARLQKLSPAQLFARLRKLDPERAKNIDRHNPVRLIRALEIVTTTGQPVPPRRNGSLLQRPEQSERASIFSVAPNGAYEPLYMAVHIPKGKLDTRIERRLDARLANGMVAEVERLHKNGVSWKRLEAFGLEYRWLARYLQKKITRTQMRDGLLLDIIHYSKRQMTWLRRNKDIHWVSSAAQAKRLVKSFLK